MSESFERLFFALWPGDGLRQEIVNEYNKHPELANQGRHVRVSNLHMTLHFLGNIPLHRVDCFIEQAGEINSQPFELALTRTGYFSRARVAWIGCEIVPQGLADLHNQLGIRIKACGFNPESRPYNPHVTMARKVRGPVETLTLNKIKWMVDHFVLLRSTLVGNAVQYQVRASYALHE